MKEKLHQIRTETSNLFYRLFDNLTAEERGAFARLLENIDHQIKILDDF